MSIPDTCAIIRTLKKPNKFGEGFRIDFHRYYNEKIKEKMMSYEIESKEKDHQMLRGDTWVYDRYDIVKIIEMSEEEKLPEEKKPVLEMLIPTYHTYKLDIEQFSDYLNTWLQNKKGIDVTLQLHGENDGDYSYFWLSFDKDEHEILLAEFYGMEDEIA